MSNRPLELSPNWPRYLSIWDASYRGETLVSIAARHGITKARAWQICRKVDNCLGIPHNYRKRKNK